MGYHNTLLSILITDDIDIAKLNKIYLDRDGATNVIAFPMDKTSISDMMPHILGDIAISVETAEKESRVAEIDFDTRFFQLLIHGILHLAGYDHEKDEQEAGVMERKSDELFEKISKT